MDYTGCSRYIIARLNGDDIENDFSRLEALVRMGIAGFIIFGGKLDEVRSGIKRLQSMASVPLVISSDLERGLGQQLKGGTTLPPARVMGLAWKKDPLLVQEAFNVLGAEASYAGINTVFAPVLDIDSNPDNPIISTRAFGTCAMDVTGPALAMTEALAKHGITACGKHYPGHGDTSADSHMGLPVVNRSIEELSSMELAPFTQAIKADIPMIMAAHLSVPALDGSGIPVTLSKPALMYLREKLGFTGLITTDAMDMKALDSYTPAEAALTALEAGADIILHPKDPEELVMDTASGFHAIKCRLDAFREGLMLPQDKMTPPAKSDIAVRLTRLALHCEGTPVRADDMTVVALTDDGTCPAAKELARLLHCQAIIVNSSSRMPELKGRNYILTVSSEVKAYKGGQARWMSGALDALSKQAGTIVSFTAAHAIGKLETRASLIHAWWNAAEAGEAVYKEYFDASGEPA